MMVMWVTELPTGSSIVEYGVGTKLTEQVTGTTHTYTAGGWHGVIHQGELLNLPPNTFYSYRVGNALTGWSYIANFTTPPLPSTASAPLVVAMYGDMGTVVPLGFKVTEQIIADHGVVPLDLIVHVGDVAYASVQITDPRAALEGSAGKLTDELELIWDSWSRQVEPLACQIPYMIGVGNHERFYNYSSFLARFRQPLPWGGSPDDIDNAIFWFSLDFGRVHFVFMSTEHPYNAGSPQQQWLLRDLAAADANRANVPWIILTGHRPMYCSEKNEESSHWPGAYFQTTIEPIMLQYHVDLYVCGHMHMYERIHPVINGTTMQTGQTYYTGNGIPQVVQGTAGAFEELDYVSPQPAWSGFRDDRYGYGRAHYINDTHLYYEFLAMETRSVVDSFWLIKGPA